MTDNRSFLADRVLNECVVETKRILIKNIEMQLWLPKLLLKWIYDGLSK